MHITYHQYFQAHHYFFLLYKYGQKLENKIINLERIGGKVTLAWCGELSCAKPDQLNTAAYL